MVSFFKKTLVFCLILIIGGLHNASPTVDVRLLQGCFSNLKPEYRQFSILGGAVARQKIESKFLMGDSKFVKLLFHHLNLNLVVSAGPERVATYLSIPIITQLLALIHKKFNKNTLEKLKTTIKAEYKGKHPKDFNKSVNQFFSTLQETFKLSPQDTYEALLVLAFLKVNCPLEVEQYYTALTTAFELQEGALFLEEKNDAMQLDEAFFQEKLVELSSVEKIDEHFALDLIQNPADYERTICSLETANQSYELPQPIHYDFSSTFKAHSFPNCFESCLLNFFQAILFDPITQTCSIDNLTKYGINPHAIDPKLYNFYTQPITSGTHQISPIHCDYAGNHFIQNAFNEVVSNKPWIIYRHTSTALTNKRRLVKLPENVGNRNVLAQRLDVTICDAPQEELYEIGSSLKNFIILVDQLLALNLFQEPQDNLENVCFNENFEQIYLKKLMERFNFTYTLEEAGLGHRLIITKATHYSFILKFSAAHTEYFKNKLHQTSYTLENMSLLEMSKKDTLLAQTFAKNALDEKDKKAIIEQNSNHPYICELIYLNNVKDQTVRLELLETLINLVEVPSNLLKQIKSLLLFTFAALNDGQYLDKVAILLLNLMRKSKQQPLNYQAQLLRDEDIKIYCIAVGILLKDASSHMFERFSNNLSLIYCNQETFDERSFFHELVRSTPSTKIIELLKLLAKYHVKNCPIVLIEELLKQSTNKNIIKELQLMSCNKSLDINIRNAIKIALYNNLSDEEISKQAKALVQLYLDISDVTLDNSSNNYMAYSFNFFETLLKNGYPVENILTQIESYDSQLSQYQEKNLCYKKIICFLVWAASKNLCIDEAFEKLKNGIKELDTFCLHLIEPLLNQNKDLSMIVELCFKDKSFLRTHYKINILTKLIIHNNTSAIPYALPLVKQGISEGIESSLDILGLLLEKDIESENIIAYFNEKFFKIEFRMIPFFDLKFAKIMIRHKKATEVIFEKITKTLINKVKDLNSFSYYPDTSVDLCLDILNLIACNQLIDLDRLCTFTWDILFLIPISRQWHMFDRLVNTLVAQSPLATKIFIDCLLRDANELHKRNNQHKDNYFLKYFLSYRNRKSFVESFKKIALSKCATNYTCEIQVLEALTLFINYQSNNQALTITDDNLSNIIIPVLNTLFDRPEIESFKKRFELVTLIHKKTPNTYFGPMSELMRTLLTCIEKGILKAITAGENLSYLEISLLKDIIKNGKLTTELYGHVQDQANKGNYKVCLKILSAFVQNSLYINEAIEMVKQAISNQIEWVELAELICSLTDCYRYSAPSKSSHDETKNTILQISKDYLESLKQEDYYYKTLVADTENQKNVVFNEFYKGIKKITEYIYKIDDHCNSDNLFYFIIEPPKRCYNKSCYDLLSLYSIQQALENKKIAFSLEHQQAVLTTIQNSYNQASEFDLKVVCSVMTEFIQREYCLDYLESIVTLVKQSPHLSISNLIEQIDQELQAKRVHSGTKRKQAGFDLEDSKAKRTKN